MIIYKAWITYTLHSNLRYSTVAQRDVAWDLQTSWLHLQHIVWGRLLSWFMTHEFDLDQLDNVDVWYLSLGSHIQIENSHSYNHQKNIAWFYIHFSSRICSYQVLNIFVVVRLCLKFGLVETDLNYLDRTKNYKRFPERSPGERCVSCELNTCLRRRLKKGLFLGSKTLKIVVFSS